jgi:hypothetical protein
MQNIISTMIQRLSDTFITFVKTKIMFYMLKFLYVLLHIIVIGKKVFNNFN